MLTTGQWWCVAITAIVIFVPVSMHLYYGNRNIHEETDREFKRWKDWATALLIVMTVLLAFDGLLLSDANIKWLVLVGGLIGFAGVVWVTTWFAKEGFWEDKNKRPILLWLGSLCFGVQISTFIITFAIKIIT